MSRQVPPHEQLPPVQKLGIRFAKRGRLRFASHRDFQRAFERALRRARVPVAYSQGFTPHPKISYAGAAPTGAASEAEYLEISVTETCDPATVAAMLDEALPPGLDIVAVVEASYGSLAERLQASAWEVSLPGTAPGALCDAVAVFLVEPAVEVERITKNGMRTLDVRAAVVRLTAERAAPVVHLVVRHLTPTVRPDDVLVGLRRVGGLPAGGAHLATRLAQGILDESAATIADPFLESIPADPRSPLPADAVPR